MDGMIPEEVGYLHRLETLSLAFNPRLSGRINRGLMKLDRLQDLELQYCAITGTIPDWGKFPFEIEVVALPWTTTKQNKICSYDDSWRL